MKTYIRHCPRLVSGSWLYQDCSGRPIAADTEFAGFWLSLEAPEGSDDGAWVWGNAMTTDKEDLPFNPHMQASSGGAWVS